MKRELISKLYTEAVNYCVKQGPSISGTQMAWVWEEKFTELIVRECSVELMKLANSYSECDNDADYMQGMLDSADIIKEHFGVNDE